MATVTLEGVSVSYGVQRVLSGASTTLAKGDRVALAGPNGSGKSTLLRVAAGELAVDAGRVLLAADSLGAGQAMIEKAVDYAGQREQFNRVIASFQAVKHMCAEMAAALEPCRSMVWYAAHALDELPDEALMMASHTKAHLSEVGQFVTRTATEVHGGMGFTDLVGLHYWFKRAGFNRQIMGSPEWLRERAFQQQDLVSEE